MITKPLISAALAGLMPALAGAAALDLPTGALETSRISQPFNSTTVPIDVFSDGIVPVVSAKGNITQQAWKISGNSLSTLQLMELLRAQVLDKGYEILLDCETDQCGGYDFRFEISVLSEPEMHVDLGDFRFLTGQRTNEKGLAEYISLIVSRGGDNGFIQMTRVGSALDEPAAIITSSKSTEPGLVRTSLPEGELETLLTTIGRAPLEDLSFVTGSAQLGKESFASLAELASYLKEHPEFTVALVGHTDSAGSLANNMALSKKRAASVMRRLISAYGIPKRQLEASGVGYLVPRASNLTREGRAQNRRVEVILTSTR